MGLLLADSLTGKSDRPERPLWQAFIRAIVAEADLKGKRT
jgi:hypothetical protein